MLKGFRDFILRGNVMDLAVAVIIGAAFTSIVTALTEKIINPSPWRRHRQTQLRIPRRPHQRRRDPLR